MKPMSYNKALEAGHEPKNYNCEVPEGKALGVLDFRIWGRSSNVQCFFIFENGEKYVLSAFRGSGYTARDGAIDFGEDAQLEGKTFELSTARNAKGRTAWLEAKTRD